MAKRKVKDHFSNVIKSSLILLASSFATFSLSGLGLFFTNSIAVKSDVMICAIDVVFYIVIVFATLKAKKMNDITFNYGKGKVEALLSFFVGVLIFCYLIIMLKLTYDKLTSMEPFVYHSYIIYIYLVVFLKNTLVFVVFKRLMRKDKSLMLKSGNTYALSAIFDNIVVLSPFLIHIFAKVIDVETYFVRENIYIYIDISAAFLLCISNLYYVFPLLKAALDQLLDKSLDEELQLRILAILARHFDEYEFLIGHYTRQSGNVCYIELHMEFDGKLLHGEVLRRMKLIAEDVQDSIPHCVVKIIPAEYRDREHLTL